MMKTNNLALAFQEVFTVILRTRFFVQRVENADSFRATLRKMISAAVKDCLCDGLQRRSLEDGDLRHDRISR